MATVPAIVGTARLGNFRLGYQPTALAAVRATRVRVTVAGTAVTARVRRQGFTIRNVLNDEPDTCTFVMSGAAPTVDQVVRVTLDSTTPRLLFNGTIQTADLTYEGKPPRVAYVVTAIDDTVRANARLPFGTWTSISATTVAQELVAQFAPGFTATHVELGLPLISVKLDGTEGMNGAMRQIAKLIGGYFYWEDFDLHLFQTEATDAPATITGAAGQLLDTPPIRLLQETSQIRTRNYGKGHGEMTTVEVPAGSALVNVASTALFNVAGGQAIAGTRTLTYTSLAFGDPLAAPWIARTPSTSRFNWNAVVWADTLGLYVAVGNAVVMTSPDGYQWTARTPAENNDWTGLAWASSLGVLVAVTTAGTNQVMTSTDGVVWTARAASAVKTWRAVTWSPTLSLFCAVANLGSVFMTSPTGTTWTSRTVPNEEWIDITWATALGLFVAVANTTNLAAVLTSPDGITWTARNASHVSGWRSVAWSPALGLLVAVSSDTVVGGSNSMVMTSTNGTAWTTNTPAYGTSWFKVIWAAELALFVAVSFVGDVMTSPDGTTWTLGVFPALGQWTSVAWGAAPGRLVAVGAHGGDIHVMTNGYNALAGVPATGTGSVNATIPINTMIHLWIQRDDLTAQAEYAARASTAEHPHDGIVEHLVSDERRGEASLISLCDADLDLFSRPIKTVPYACRDVRTKAGKPQTFAISSPAIAETLTIQEVTITEIDVSPGLAPRFTASASSVRFSLEDLLRRMNALLES